MPAQPAPISEACSDVPDDPARPLDTPRLRLGRLARLREHMLEWRVDACVLFDPINIRYATGARNMTPFMHRNPARYLFVPAEGPVVLFEFTGAAHLAEGLETVDEVRPAVTVSAVAADIRVDERAREWADEIAALVRRHCGAGARVGIERQQQAAVRALAGHDLTVVDAQQPVERARARKTPEELRCVRASAEATMAAVRRLEAAIEPGRSENAVWAELHAETIARDGDYVETRLFNSGPRTNPWFQESSPRVIRAGELVALDTDVVGAYGYYSDFSRTFLAGDGRPTAHQRELYRLAMEEIEHNAGLIRPGVRLREIAENAWPIPARYFDSRYFVAVHGCGMTGEYPYVLHAADFEGGYDGEVEAGMVLCVESYIGEPGGGEGVKLENEYLVTDTGVENLTPYPLDPRLSGAV
ncbi:Dimethlysulfonioproprionate lyase DddP [wastewater metagenome]|uniref:Dimethlysulfonioproprionate lyase DddP n=2 Tax=unclassified sequences TaxID=12908 RepID=A0A5B8RG41_9ZZZZ|nr:Xaa-Pro peptidase family protein [Arhodomonas sp. KWT]QEA06474.1 dimethlysulfonioproprionate lyase DddP [uncultured organism]